MESNELIKAYGTEYKEMTKRLLEKAGLKDDVFRKVGDKKAPELARIALKPNLVCTSPAKFGATTHTEIAAGIIEYLKENGFTNVVIAEGSWVGDRTAEAFEYCGFNALAEEYGVELIDTQKDGHFSADCSGMQLEICSCVKTFDFLINLPVLKGHCQTKMTCALKNMKGLIPNSEKRHFHTMGLHKPIAHLNSFIRPNFIVIDHICGDPDFEEGGNPLIRNCVMVGKDPVLTDAYAAKLLGYEPDEIEYIRIAERLGIGTSDLSQLHILTIEGENTEDLPDTRKILAVSYAAEAIDSCSACYGSLIAALDRLKTEGLLDDVMKKLPGKIAIGQGYKGKTGACGIGQCTKLFDFNIPGCPPKEETIYSELKKLL